MRHGDWMILGHWDGPMLKPGGSVQAGDTALVKRHFLTDFELYNLRDDLRQLRDLGRERPEKLAQLSKLLVAKYREVQAEGPEGDVPPRNR